MKKSDFARSFNFVQVDPRPTAAEATEKMFAENQVFGIEMTIPQLAARCVENLDHHGADSGKQPAIMQALTCQLPKDGTVIATIKPDLDSVGAMAVLCLRREESEHMADYQESVWGNRDHCGTSFTPRYFGGCVNFDHLYRFYTLMERVKTVAAADVGALRAANEWQPGTLPSATNPWPTSLSIDSVRDLAAIAAAVADFKISLSERVEVMKKWLLDSVEPTEYREKVEAERLDLVEALEHGRTTTVVEDQIVTVISEHRAATSIGYALAPIVIALNPNFHLNGADPVRKFTVCQYTPGKYLDLPAVWAELSGLEPGWGGNAGIGGSPQGVSSKLDLEAVLKVVKKHLI